VKATLDHLRAAIARDGNVFARSAEMRELLQQSGWIADWNAFAASWDGMPLDEYMAAANRCRRRRYAVYRVTREAIVREPHQPHQQSKDYNPLFGDVPRWFEAVPEKIGESASMRTIIGFCRRLFGELAPDVQAWHVEVHQFRIEAASGKPGTPTPEGVHRDGVDWVCVLLVRRQNIGAGTTTIHAPDGTPLGEFTLADPLDAALIDDHRVYHGVTPVEALEPAQPAFRDVLVVTFRRTASSA
jgi:hypothetical protein